MAQMPTTIIGNLTKEPELIKTGTGNVVCRLRLASSRSIRDDAASSGWREVDSLFINAELWGQPALNAHTTLRKGTSVIAVGRLVTDEWEVDRQQPAGGYPGSEGGGEKEKRRTIKFKVDRLGLDLTRCIAGWKRTDTQEHAVEGVAVPDIPDRSADDVGEESQLPGRLY